MARTYTKVGWQDGTVLTPAKVTIDGTDYEVEPAVESGTTPVDATNLDKMDTAIYNAVTDINGLETNKIDNAAIELLAVTDTAPSECTTGDKYYNTTNGLIYTATGTDTWSSTGELPSSDYLYIDLGNQQLYYYDGTNFNSYGGGGGSTEVYIQDTEPTEPDAKLWIDTGEIAQAHTEITNEYSTSTGLGYSANYVNNLHTYSTTEQRIGTWIDGKPLYQRIVYISSLPNNDTGYYDIFSSSEIGNIGVCFMDEGNSYMTITAAGHTETDTMNWIYSTTAFIMTCVYDKQIRIITKDNKSATSAYITIKYTKTTD